VTEARPQRWTWFGLVSLAALALVVVSVTRARQAPESGAATGAATAAAAPLAAPPSAPYVVVRHLGPGDAWGRVALAPLGSVDGPRYVTPLRCMRVHFAGGRGLCLDSNGVSGQAIVFDARFDPLHALPLSGPPSRTRVSADGRRGAFTVFEQGHSYADTSFSTRTTIVDLSAGTVIADLEAFALWQDAKRIRRVDTNFWGVTFAPDGNRFYATAAFGGTPYLVEGDVDRREVRVLASRVECPSLSPDGRRIAFKRATGFEWRLWTLDLATGAEHLVAGEVRSIDDQVEWLDTAHLLYQFPSDDGNNVWTVNVDDAAPAHPFMAEAWSPAVVR
jgi:hypothetical protein